MRHAKIDMSSATRVGGEFFQGVRNFVRPKEGEGLGDYMTSRANGARMFMAATRARLVEPDPASAIDMWCEDEGQAAYDELDHRYRTSPNRLLRGGPVDLLEHAIETYRPNDYPTLYQDIPADLRNPIHWDGKVLGGGEVPTLARRHLRPEVYSTAVSMASRNALALTTWLRRIIMTAGIVSAIAYGIFGYRAGLGYPKWAAAAGFDGPVFGWYASLLGDTLTIAATAIVLAFAAARLSFSPFRLFATNRILDRYFDRVQAPLLYPCRDAKLIYAQKESVRDEEYLAYSRQVRTVNAEDRPLAKILFPVGRSRGTLRSRGVMQAPVRGAALCLDGESIRQHVLILGGTGSGKTRLAIRPLASRIMTTDWGQDRKIGAYITDGKGTLWTDLFFAKGFAQREDVRVVGAGSYSIPAPDGSVLKVQTYGCNLLEGMTPAEVGDMFEAIYSQLGGSSDKDMFWVRNAAIAMQHGAELARFVQDCPDQELRKYFNNELNVSPYTFLGIAKIVYDCVGDGCLLDRVVAFAQKQHDADPLQFSDSLKETLSWVVNSWKTMAGETRSGVLANIGTVIQKLTGSPALAAAFAQYTQDKKYVIDVDHALDGGILMISVGEDEFGVAGKIVTCCLKTRLYIRAKRRLQAEGRKAREKVSVAMIADEFQLLATTGSEGDSTFWNTARETGVFGVIATQSCAALQAQLGDRATNNLLDLFRSKIVLSTEEKATQEYCQRLAGTVMTGWKTQENFFETVHEREKSYPDVGYSWLESSLFDGVFPKGLALTIKSLAPIIAQDNRFVDQYGTDEKSGGRNAKINAQKEAWNRFIDKNQSELTNGLKEVPALNVAELNRGSGIGFVYLQRAGGVRLDVVDFEKV